MDFISFGIKIANLLTTYWPTNKISLERIEYLQARVENDNLKLYLKLKKQRLLFLMSTGLVENRLNTILFENFAAHPELLNRFNPRIAQYFKMNDSKLQIKKKQKIRLRVWMTYGYYTFLFVSSTLLIVGSFIRYKNLHNAYLVFVSIFAWIFITIVGMVMIGNKLQDIQTLKLYKEKYKD